MKRIYLIISAIFLFNPIFSNLDVLPDFIGYFLIMLALSKSTYTNENAQDAYNSARKMLIVSVAKTLSLLLVSSSDVTMSLLLSFSFLIVELIFGIPFVLKLFNYLSELAIASDNGRETDKCTKVAYFTIATMIARLVFAMLPDLTALTLNNGVDTDVLPVLTGFRPMLFIVTGTLSFIVCTIWLVIVEIHFVKLINKDVENKCKSIFVLQVKDNKPLFEAKNCIAIMIIFVIGAILAFDVRYLNYLIVPDALMTLVFVCGFAFMLIKEYQKLTPFHIALAITFIGQVVFFGLETKATYDFYSLYSLAQIGEKGALPLYNKISLWSGISSILFVIAVCLIMLLLIKCGKNALTKNKELFEGCDFSYQIEEYKKKSKINFIIVSIASLACGAVYFSMIYNMPYNQDFMMYNGIVRVIFIALLIKAILYVHDETYKRIYSYSLIKVK
ncbi:MAG: hypothetical protein IJ400_01020 [Clostridia bacterium]|nr:hypothetical protein [Clostridia bacterium]